MTKRAGPSAPDCASVECLLLMVMQRSESSSIDSDPTLGLKYWHLDGEEAYNPVLQLGGAVTGCKHSVIMESCDGISIHL